MNKILLPVLFVVHTVFSMQEVSFPASFSQGPVEIRINFPGIIDVLHNKNKVAVIQYVWFMDENWKQLPRKEDDRLSLFIDNETKEKTVLLIKDKREGVLASYSQQVIVTKNELIVRINYTYASDLSNWHLPVYLPTAAYAGAEYTVLLTNEVRKTGTLPVYKADKVIYGYNEIRNIKTMAFPLENTLVTFQFSNLGWSFCDHRSVPSWDCFMFLSSASTKKKGVSESYEIRIVFSSSVK